jgi:Ni/Co efflux regulator RcnB
MKRILMTLLDVAFCATVNPCVAKDDAPKKMSDSQKERMHKKNKRNADEAWAKDKKKRSRDEMAEMEKDYQEIEKNYKDAQDQSGNPIIEIAQGMREWTTKYTKV